MRIQTYEVVEVHGVPIGVGVQDKKHPGTYHLICNLILPAEPMTPDQERKELSRLQNQGRLIVDALNHWLR